MINYTFQMDSSSETKKMSGVIKKFIPNTNFTVNEGHFGLEINCKFENEQQKDSFIKVFSELLHINEDGTYEKFELPKD